MSAVQWSNQQWSAAPPPTPHTLISDSETMAWHWSTTCDTLVLSTMLLSVISRNHGELATVKWDTDLTHNISSSPDSHVTSLSPVRKYFLSPVRKYFSSKVKNISSIQSDRNLIRKYWPLWRAAGSSGWCWLQWLHPLLIWFGKLWIMVFQMIWGDQSVRRWELTY